MMVESCNFIKATNLCINGYVTMSAVAELCKVEK